MAGTATFKHSKKYETVALLGQFVYSVMKKVGQWRNYVFWLKPKRYIVHLKYNIYIIHSLTSAVFHWIDFDQFWSSCEFVKLILQAVFRVVFFKCFISNWVVYAFECIWTHHFWDGHNILLCSKILLYLYSVNCECLLKNILLIEHLWFVFFLKLYLCSTSHRWLKWNHTWSLTCYLPAAHVWHP